MSHVSKKHLDQKIFRVMYERLHASLISLKNKKESIRLTNELLTPTERIMIAKRLAIIYLLHKGHSIYEVEQTLKVSPSTVARYSLRSDSKEFVFLLSLFKKNEGFGAVLDGLEKFLAGRVRGRDRWDFISKL